MSQTQKHLDAIQRSDHVDLPGSSWRAVPQLLLMTALFAFSVGLAWGSPSTSQRIGGMIAAPVCLLGIVDAIHRIVTRRGAIRIRPEGIAERAEPVIPWRMLAEAEAGRDTDDAHDMRVLLILSSEGRDWARRNDIRLKDVHKPLRARGIEMPVLRGCNHQETADVLTVAIRINRQRLGLPPVG